MRSDGRGCWGSTFPAEAIRVNDGAVFDAR
jgi:hypothetical protein